MRYKPGFKINFFSKWCKITKSHFLYYKTKYSAIILEKPLFNIPLALIKFVQSVKVKVPNYEKRKSSANFIYAFEIFLIDNIDYSAIIMDSPERLKIQQSITLKSPISNISSITKGKETSIRSTDVIWIISHHTWCSNPENRECQYKD